LTVSYKIMSTQITADTDDSMSLSQHEATYVQPESAPAETPEPAPVPEPQPEPTAEPEPESEDAKPERPDAGGERDEHGRWKPKEKHRAKSQHATPADVPRIQALTKKLREAEERAAKLEQQMKAPRPAPIPAPPKEFADAEPKYEDFANEPDQYAAWMRAVTAFDRKKDSFEQQKTAHTTAREAEIKQRNEQRDQWFKEKLNAHGQRIEQLYTTNPEAEKTIEAANVDLNPVMLAALISAENSDQLALKLAQDPELVDDLHLLTDDKQPSADLVAYVQRRMNRGVKVGTTGSTAPAPVVPALPRPPNPVRTGVMKAADTPPGDDASLSEHERAYGTGRRRR
jgi:hypothetical protein